MMKIHTRLFPTYFQCLSLHPSSPEWVCSRWWDLFPHPKCGVLVFTRHLQLLSSSAFSSPPPSLSLAPSLTLCVSLSLCLSLSILLSLSLPPSLCSSYVFHYSPSLQSGSAVGGGIYVENPHAPIFLCIFLRLSLHSSSLEWVCSRWRDYAENPHTPIFICNSRSKDA